MDCLVKEGSAVNGRGIGLFGVRDGVAPRGGAVPKWVFLGCSQVSVVLFRAEVAERLP